MKITELQKEWMADRFEVYGYDEILRTYGYEVEDDTWDTHNGYCPETTFGYVPSEKEFHRTFEEVAKWIKEKEFPTQVTTLQMYVVEDCIEWAAIRCPVYEEGNQSEWNPKPEGSFTRSYKNLEKKFDLWKQNINAE